MYMYVCMYEMIYEWLAWFICEHLMSWYAWEVCDTWVYVMNWSRIILETWAYTCANVDYVIWWSYVVIMIMTSDKWSMLIENLMSYSWVHDYVPYDYRHVKGHV